MKFNQDSSIFSLKDIELIAFDFDGIFTDDKVYVNEDGKESVACSRIDSLGIAVLLKEIERIQSNTRVLVVSTETNNVVRARCKKMKLEAYTGISNKADFILDFTQKYGLNLKFSIFAGNDLNDLAAMSLFGLRFAPSNADIQIKKIATNNLKSFGGNGFIRELVELIAPEAFSSFQL